MKIQCVVLRVDGKFYLETYSSIAQSVEHAAVNRAVVGSSPTRGVMQKWRNWQTRRLQVPVVARSCGFKSHLPHSDLELLISQRLM